MPIRRNSSLELQEFQEAASEPAELDVADEEQPCGSGDDNRWYICSQNLRDHVRIGFLRPPHFSADIYCS